MTALLAALGRIEDIQQRIRSLSAEPAAPAATGQTGAATGSTGTRSASATAFADAVRDAGEYATPRGGDVTGADIVAQAKNYIGVPYVFGGEDRSGMDCSGLVQRVLADLGIDVPRVVKDQADVGVEVPSLAEAQPGDLIVTKGEGHIVIYAGDGMVIHAPSPGKFVEHRNNWLKDGDIATIRRMVPAAEAAPAASVAPAGGQAAPAIPAGTASTVVDRAALAGVASMLSPTSADLAAPAVGSIAQALSAAAGGGSTSPLPVAAPEAAESPLGLAIAQAVSRASVSATAIAAAPVDADAAASALLSGAAAPAPSTGAPDAAPPAAAPAPARAPLAQQLSAPVMSLASRGDGEHTMTVRVSPDDLGPITVKAHIAGGSIAIELVSGSAAGRDALRALLVDLRRDLAVLAPHSTVAVATTDAPRGDPGSTGTGIGSSAGQSASGQSSAGGSGSGDPSGHTAARRDDRDAAVVAAATPAASPAPTAPLVGAAGIDLFV